MFIQKPILLFLSWQLHRQSLKYKPWTIAKDSEKEHQIKNEASLELASPVELRVLYLFFFLRQFQKIRVNERD